MHKTRKIAAVVLAAGLIGGTPAAYAAPSSKPAPTVLRFTDTTIRAVALTKDDFSTANVDKKIGGRHHKVGYSTLSGHYDEHDKTISLHGVFARRGGLIYVSLSHVAPDAPTVRGTVDGGTGTYAGATGTFKVANAARTTSTVTLRFTAAGARRAPARHEAPERSSATVARFANVGLQYVDYGRTGDFSDINVDKRIGGRHRVLGYAAVTVVYDRKHNTVKDYAVFSRRGGLVYVSLKHRANIKKIRGTVDGGTGVYAGAHGTVKITGGNTNRAVVTLRYTR